MTGRGSSAGLFAVAGRRVVVFVILQRLAKREQQEREERERRSASRARRPERL